MSAETMAFVWFSDAEHMEIRQKRLAVTGDVQMIPVASTAFLHCPRLDAPSAYFPRRHGAVNTEHL